jgi:adenylosuccinate lyase
LSKTHYESPLCSRYASDAMQRLFSQDHRSRIWRRLWLELARAQHQLGLPVSEAQVAELEQHTEDIDFDLAASKEAELRHDVMAHIHTYGACCPGACGIIHLGATSCYVTDNADLIIYREALRSLRGGLLAVMGNLAAFADRYKALPTLGYTHGQPAQLVTMGKRACLYLQDLESDLHELDHLLATLRFFGCRGTTGTEASFLSLFGGDTAKIDAMNEKIAAAFGFESLYPIASQTYPRKEDSRILNVLSGIAQSAYRFAGDLRLLAHMRQVEEPFEDTQVGSSAMAYKRNPMRSERICSLSRYVMVDALNAPLTAATQWLERSLDDSANRRISLPEAFLAIDAILRLMRNVSGGLVVNEMVIMKEVERYLPFIATENLLMSAVKKGGNRQEMHEIIRRHSHEQSARLKQGEDCQLLEALAAAPRFPLDAAEIAALIQPADFIGRCEEQVMLYLNSLALELPPADCGEDICL